MGSDPHSELTETTKGKLAVVLDEVFGLPADGLRADLRLEDVEGWDSMNSINFTMELENGFGVDLEGVILSGEQTIGEVVALLKENGAEV